MFQTETAGTETTTVTARATTPRAPTPLDILHVDEMVVFNQHPAVSLRQYRSRMSTVTDVETDENLRSAIQDLARPGEVLLEDLAWAAMSWHAPTLYGMAVDFLLREGPNYPQFFSDLCGLRR